MGLITERNLPYIIISILLCIALISISRILIRLVLRQYYGRVLISIKASDFKIHISALMTNILIIISTIIRLDSKKSTLLLLIEYQKSNSLVDPIFIDTANQDIFFLRFMIILFVIFALISIIKALTPIRLLERGIFSNKGMCKWKDINAFNWENESANSITLRLKINRKLFKYMQLIIEKENKSILENILVSKIN